jgi:hypothetical protein
MSEYDKISKIDCTIKKVNFHIRKEKIKLSIFQAKFNAKSFITTILNGDAEPNQTANLIFTTVFASITTWLVYYFENVDKLTSVEVAMASFFIFLCSLGVFSILLQLLDKINPINNKDIIKMMYPFKNIIFNEIEKTSDVNKIFFLLKYYEKHKMLPPNNNTNLVNVDHTVVEILLYLYNIRQEILTNLETSIMNDD